MSKVPREHSKPEVETRDNVLKYNKRIKVPNSKSNSKKGKFIKSF